MADRKKVIKGLECCMKWTGEPNTATCHCSDCSYTNMDILGERCLIDLINDALALLKEQDPVKPHYNTRTNWYECGSCHYSMTSGMHCRSDLIPATKVRYCANCGFPVNWEGV